MSIKSIYNNDQKKLIEESKQQNSPTNNTSFKLLNIKLFSCCCYSIFQ